MVFTVASTSLKERVSQSLPLKRRGQAWHGRIGCTCGSCGMSHGQVHSSESDGGSGGSGSDLFPLFHPLPASSSSWMVLAPPGLLGAPFGWSLHGLWLRSTEPRGGWPVTPPWPQMSHTRLSWSFPHWSFPHWSFPCQSFPFHSMKCFPFVPCWIVPESFFRPSLQFFEAQTKGLILALFLGIFFLGFCWSFPLSSTGLTLNCPFAAHFQTRGWEVLREKPRHCYYETFRNKINGFINSRVIKPNLMWMEEPRAEQTLSKPRFSRGNTNWL